MIKTNIKDSYKLYKKDSKNPIDIKRYLILNGLFNKFIISKVLDGEAVSLPERLGILSIIGKKEIVNLDENQKITGLAPDWVKTKEYRKKYPESDTIIYHFNEHTSGIRYRYKWTKKNFPIVNKTLYSLRLTRANKRAVYKKIKFENKEYITE